MRTYYNTFISLDIRFFFRKRRITLQLTNKRRSNMTVIKHSNTKYRHEIFIEAINDDDDACCLATSITLVCRSCTKDCYNNESVYLRGHPIVLLSANNNKK